MNPNVFKEALKEAETELDQILIEESALDERRLELEKRVARLTENISHLAALADDTTSFRSDILRMNADSGLNAIVLQVVHAADSPLTVVKIKERAEILGFNTSRYQNILATLHITLDRLSKNNGPVEKQKDAEGKKVYRPNPNYSPFKLALDPERLRKALQNSATEAIKDSQGIKPLTRRQARLLREASSEKLPPPRRHLKLPTVPTMEEAVEAAKKAEGAPTRSLFKDSSGKKD